MGLHGNPEPRKQKSEVSDVTSGWNQGGENLIQGHPLDQWQNEDWKSESPVFRLGWEGNPWAL